MISLMESCTVEAELHGSLDVEDESLVGGSGVNAVGIETLVQDQPLIETIVVQVHNAVPHFHLAHTKIGIYPVKLLLPVCKLHTQVIQRRPVGAPKRHRMECIPGVYIHHNGNIPIYIRSRDATNLLFAQGYIQRKGHFPIRHTVEQDLRKRKTTLNIRCDMDVINTQITYSLQIDGLPNAAA